VRESNGDKSIKSSESSPGFAYHLTEVGIDLLSSAGERFEFVFSIFVSS